MANQPELFNLVWRTFSFVAREDTSEGEFSVASHHVNTIDTRPSVPAVILFPALLTPDLHVRGENQGMIEMLVAARKSPSLKPEHVNCCLKIVRGLDPKKRVSDKNLFFNPKEKIIVKEAVQKDGHIETHGIFVGILHPAVANWLPKELDAFYAVQIHDSCLKNVHDASSESGSDDPGELEYQDFKLDEVLHKWNGPALRKTKAEGGRGTHEFVLTDDGVDYARVNLEKPIVSYHPLYVYPEGDLQSLNFGHVSDMHLNARQRLLAQSPARVIDFCARGSADLRGDEDAAAKESPPIGKLQSTFDSSFVSILDQMKARGDGMDVLLVGGDLVEHVDNAFPYHDTFGPEQLEGASAATIWDLVDVDKNYKRNYQAYVDYIAFFTFIRDFCTSAGKPAFVVSGNHDAYKNHQAYGISPRVLGLYAANQGIPADHNLTFYEAILVFGESYADTSFLPLMEKAALTWFFAAFTPFSDFSIELPKHRLVALGWGNQEQRIDGRALAGRGGQGFGHLGHAKEAATPAQLMMLRPDHSKEKKIVLMTHFTLVSYHDTIACNERPTAGQINVRDIEEIIRRDRPFAEEDKPFSYYDWGTFQQGRASLYGEVVDSRKFACVMTGHAHRKGLYFLGPSKDHCYPTEAYALRSARGFVQDAATHINGRTPIIVSDCGGPLPRLNLNNEFVEWGSDRPSGTVVQVSPEGQVTRIEIVPSAVEQAKPRLAVAVDYMHVMKEHVFKEIKVEAFPRAKATTCQHHLTITFNEYFPDSLASGLDVILFGRPALNADWIRIELKTDEFIPSVHHEKKNSFKVKDEKTTSKATEPARARFEVPRKKCCDFYTWLTLGSRSGRFLSFGFAGAGGFEDIYDASSRWNLEVEAKPSWWNVFRSGSQGYEIHTHKDDGGGSLSGTMANLFRFEAPSFTWRRQYLPYQ
jgi:hypothetical protein